jgi:hypothetical protein
VKDNTKIEKWAGFHQTTRRYIPEDIKQRLILTSLYDVTSQKTELTFMVLNGVLSQKKRALIFTELHGVVTQKI